MDKMDDINCKTENFLNEICDNMGLSEDIKRKPIKENCMPGINRPPRKLINQDTCLSNYQV